MGKIEDIGNPKDQRDTKSYQGVNSPLKGPDDQTLNDKGYLLSVINYYMGKVYKAYLVNW